tara:strand:- start:596 stop:946 length:351 start_codon:yes stop_codon:yes gene_type:complete
MAGFSPILPGPASITGGGVYDPFVENTFQSGDHQVREIFTKPRRSPMTFSWEMLTLEEKDALVSHREQQRSTPFQYVHPVSGKVMTIHYTSEKVSWDETYEKKGYYSAKAVFQEVV